MSAIGEHPVGVRWFGVSGELFCALKREFALTDTWAFSVAGPDVAPSDADPQDLRDLDGAAAFMLRRIQAIRKVLIDGATEPERLIVGYASDLYTFLFMVLSEGRIDDPTNEGIIVTGAEATRDVVALAVALLDAGASELTVDPTT